MGEFDELDAMRKIAAALEPLDDAARARALHWASSRFRGSNALTESGLERFADIALDAASSGPFGSFADLFNAANPTTEKDRALVAAYWMQKYQNVGSFASQSLNELLKDLGHGVGNITEALNQLRRDRPALILQLKKSGTSKQARKTHKLTNEGAKRVSAMIEGAESRAEQG
ncbi:hypothetical protein BH10PSE7_BH10PSE7_00970 [soil metagenome]